MQARETESIEFAPIFFFCLVPSRLIIIWSNSFCSSIGLPNKAGCIKLFIFSMAFLVPFPSNLSSLSLSSNASFFPVEAPLGTMASPLCPEFKTTDVWIEGTPLESSISIASIDLICIIYFFLIRESSSKISIKKLSNSESLSAHGPSHNALEGSGCVSRNKPAIP